MTTLEQDLEKIKKEKIIVYSDEELNKAKALMFYLDHLGFEYSAEGSLSHPESAITIRLIIPFISRDKIREWIRKIDSIRGGTVIFVNPDFSFETDIPSKMNGGNIFVSKKDDFGLYGHVFARKEGIKGFVLSLPEDHKYYQRDFESIDEFLDDFEGK